MKVSSCFYVPIFPIKISLGKGLPVGPDGCLLNSGTVGVYSETHGKTILIAFFAVRYYAVNIAVSVRQSATSEKCLRSNSKEPQPLLSPTELM
jgi:hypothetical protein